MSERLRLYRGSGDDPKTDLAFEEDQLEAASRGEPSLSLYAWRRPALVLGYAQDPVTVGLGACRRLGIPVLRRITGGTGVLHQHALSASLALPASHPWASSIASLYDGFVEAAREAAMVLGCPLERGRGHATPAGRRSPICFEDTLTESLTRAGRKVLGCAQARRRDACLVHGTFLLGLDAPLQAAVYEVPQARVETALGCLPPVPPGALGEAWASALARGAGLAIDASGPPAPSSASLARYAASRWRPGGVD